jgi:hypothetical protein
MKALPTVTAVAFGVAVLAVSQSQDFVQEAYIKASDIAANDRFGSSVAISGSTLVVRGNNDRSACVFTRNESEWTQQACLTISAGDATNLPITSMAIFGDTIVLATTDGAGVAHVFKPGNDQWIQSAVLNGSDAVNGDNFGVSVAIFDNTIVIGAPNAINDIGEAYIFRSTNDAWLEVAKVTASSPNQGAQFGTSIAVFDNTIAIGAPYANGGAAYLFGYNAEGWSQQAYIENPTPIEGDSFGKSVAIGGDTIVIGAPDKSVDGIPSGAAYVFESNGEDWVQKASLANPNKGFGNLFGQAVAISANTILIGSPGSNSYITLLAENAIKKTYIPDGDIGTAWTQLNYNDAGWLDVEKVNDVGQVVGGGIGYARNKPPGTDVFDPFIALDLEEQMSLSSCAYLRIPFSVNHEDHFDEIVLSARVDDGFVAYINGQKVASFKAPDSPLWNSGATTSNLDSAAITMVDYPLNDGSNKLVFGENILAIHALNLGRGSDFLFSCELHRTSTSGRRRNTGNIYAFTRDQENWSQQDSINVANSDTDDRFGANVAIFGNTIVTGVEREAGNGSNPDNNSFPNAGAVYTFRSTAPSLLQDQSFTLAENSPTGTIIGVLNLTLPNDLGPIFRVISNTDPDNDGEPAFRLDGDQLVVNDSGDLDYDITPTLNIILELQLPNLRTVDTITIELTDNTSEDGDGDGLTDEEELALGSDPTKPDTDDDGLSDFIETNTGIFISAQNTGTSPINPDTDEDGLSDSVETNTGIFVSREDTGSNPHKFDSDGDGLSDGNEVRASRYSIVRGAFRWDQARLDAESKRGMLATFPTAHTWLNALEQLGGQAFDDVTGLWIGATDTEEEGQWQWIAGEPFNFNNWANGQPDNAGEADHAEVSGRFGAARGFWFDTPGEALRDGYILEKPSGTDPNNPDTDGDGLSDSYEASTQSFSVVREAFKWNQARLDAESKGGVLATFPTEQIWESALEQIGAQALDDVTGLWIGATDAAVEGQWQWVNQQPIDELLILSSIPLIEQGTDWKYLDDGSDQGTAWRDVDFDDSAWATGFAELGFGDNNEVTVIEKGPAGAQHASYYFRRTFNISTNQFTQLLFRHVLVRLKRDDGAVVYLNGEEIIRDNMPLGEVNHLTFASLGLGGSNESTFLETLIDGTSNLRLGKNVLAVSIHQSSQTSTDLSFDMEIVANHIPTLSFSNWANGQPDNAGEADHAEVSGAFGAARGFWFDTPGAALREGYILEKSTNPLIADTDGDGFSDGEEVTRGSNPTDPNSFPSADSLPPFRLTVNATRLPSGAIDQLNLSFPAKSGTSYKIEASTNLRDWEVLEEGINGNGNAVQRNFPAGGATWFLRASEE